MKKGRPTKEGPATVLVESQPRTIKDLKGKVSQELEDFDINFSELAELCEWTPSYLSKVLSAERISWKNYVRICEALILDPTDWLE